MLVGDFERNPQIAQSTMYIGAFDTTTNPYQGNLAHFAVFSTKLSDSEIRNLESYYSCFVHDDSGYVSDDLLW